jgi:hypothetical protein
MRKPDLSLPQILGWIDSFHERTGKWPRKDSGAIPGALDETWQAVEMALRNGNRGLSGRSSLAQLLFEQRGVRNRMKLPRLTEEQILAWMESHYQRTGMWPTHESGPILDAPGEQWRGVDRALRRGRRGLPAGSSLSHLLAEYRQIKVHRRRAPLTVGQILSWIDAYRVRTGQWPTMYSGPIAEAKGETWMMVHVALRRGKRGLPGGSSLARLLLEQRGVRPLRFPPLNLEQIQAWAEAHRERTGEWPNRTSGLIPEAPRETWLAVDKALRNGLRGLPGGSSLSRVLRQRSPRRSRRDSTLGKGIQR